MNEQETTLALVISYLLKGGIIIYVLGILLFILSITIIHITHTSIILLLLQIIIFIYLSFLYFRIQFDQALFLAIAKRELTEKNLAIALEKLQITTKPHHDMLSKALGAKYLLKKSAYLLSIQTILLIILLITSY